MRYLRPFLLLALAWGAGCAPAPVRTRISEPPLPFNPRVGFPDALPDSAEYAPFLAGGTGTISGQAFMKTRGGDVKLGAGNIAYLDPVTTYSRDWWIHRGQKESGIDVRSPDALFNAAQRQVIIDAQGKFRFDKVAPGHYYVRSTVKWYVGGSYGTQGGLVSAEVEVKAGETTEVILTG